MALTLTNMSSSHPRISFSHDFVDSNFLSHQHQTPNPPPSSSDFEFSVSNHSMMSADELFSKGKMLPFKNSGKKKSTLREELVAGHEDGGGGCSVRPPKGFGSGRWREILGLKKAHVGPRKHAKPDGPIERRFSVGYDPEAHSNVSLQDTENDEGGSSRRDGDFIIRM